eukprot:jgi/Mesvir1/13931/Mv16052-RA.1
MELSWCTYADCRNSDDCASDEICFSNTCVALTDGCPHGWTYSAAGCLQLITYLRNISNQASACASLWPSASNPGHLAKITSVAMNDAVRDACKIYECFIGLSDVDDEDVFRWQDASPATYFNWAASEPQNSGAVDFVFINKDGEWVMTDGTGLYLAVCQINPFCDKDTHCSGGKFCVDHTCVVLTNNCPPGWLFYPAAGCLKARPGSAIEASQRADCESMWPSGYPGGSNAGHLAKITSSDANTAVRVECNGGSCYIGLNDANNETLLLWHDHTWPIYLNWANGEPQNSGLNDVVYMDSSGYWHMSDGTSVIGGVCQITPLCDKYGSCPAGTVCDGNKCLAQRVLRFLPPVFTK